MDSFSTRLSAFSPQRIVRYLTAIFLAECTFWGLISKEDIPRPPFRFSKGMNVLPRSDVRIRGPGAIAALVLGIVFGYIVIAGIICLYCCRRRLRQRSHTGASSAPESTTNTVFELAASPSQLWKPTGMELDMASRASRPEAPLSNTPLSAGNNDDGLDFGLESTPSFNATQETTILAAPEAPNNPLPKHVEGHNSQTLQQSGPSGPRLPEAARLVSARIEPEYGSQGEIQQFPCPISGCSKVFSKQYELNHHMRYHEKSKKCETCDKSFGTITHLERHVDSAHLSTKRYYCTVAGCKYSKTVANPRFFPRKDNWRRHMRDRHELS